MNADTGAIDWYYQYLPCDDWDQDFVQERTLIETGEFLWADPFPFESTERFVISDVDVETGTTYINMDLVAREEGDQFIICGHNVKGWWSWSYSPVTGMLYVLPINRSCLNQTTIMPERIMIAWNSSTATRSCAASMPRWPIQPPWPCCGAGAG